jgi:hypothetical protein
MVVIHGLLTLFMRTLAVHMQQAQRAPETVVQGRSGWFVAYCAAMLESSREMTLARVERAQKAIRDRFEELRFAPHGDREERDLRDALSHLGNLLNHLGSDRGRLLWD